ncbi:sulfate adenylyltransferase subunit 1 [Ruania alba]|uniref:sulfate adenylyltransferase n=1 Tax=Ruania alba TaxID=648782 RepID=A0A1H5B7G9_9MICO|nr:GTP-binding protein [Ruania alba]SED50355.1 sulfate adenylyltransferase subunit 1 [Ruania alba]
MGATTDTTTGDTSSPGTLTWSTVTEQATTSEHDLATDPTAVDPDAVDPTAAGTLLRLATAGSVDDGKSTLVGRLLYDSKSVLADQWESIERVSTDRGQDTADLALLTDGLRAEREQGITIDVAYRYFATATRSFILADCPGHVQYTRNTVTGASTADAVVLLIDARKGVLEQTRRHLAVVGLLRVPHVVVAVNKIDLVDYSRERFTELAEEIRDAATALGVPHVHPIPVSALVGDNVVTPATDSMPWYEGPSLLELLEALPVADSPGGEPFRLPVQSVLRPQAAAVSEEYREYRGYAGQIAAGVVRVGDTVVVLPSGKYTQVEGIDTPDGELAEAFAPQSVSLRLSDEIDIARGDLIAAAEGAPSGTKEITGTVSWLSDQPLRPGARVLLKQTTRTVRAIVSEVTGRLDLLSAAPEPAEQLELNDIGTLRIKLADAVVAEDYKRSRRTGAFLLIDAHDGNTLAAGMVGTP